MSEGSGQILQEGPLRYYAARHTTVLAATPLGQFKLFQIAFGKDGSIYLPFPYLETKRGLLSEVDPSIEPDPKTISLRRNGIDVTTDVKFSHHTSGIVQFSKTGGQDLLPRRQSFRLDGPIGKIFDLHVYWLHGFTQFDPEKAGKTFLLPFQLPDEHRTSLHVWAEWRRKKDIIDNLEPGGTWLGPGVSAITRATGTEVRFLPLGQPEGCGAKNGHHWLKLVLDYRSPRRGLARVAQPPKNGSAQHKGRPMEWLIPYKSETPAITIPIGSTVRPLRRMTRPTR